MSARRGREVDGIFLLDKPPGMTSNQALQRVRRLFDARKAGHTGSLDPLATGVLPICLGVATKLSGLLLDADKRYWVRARLGVRTDTADAEGAIVAESDASGATRAELEAALATFAGVGRQVPPMYSALKHAGKRLYQLAREGIEVERQPRTVELKRLRCTAFGDAHFELEVDCSKGTYIRALVEDVAQAIGQHAHVVALRRRALGAFDEQATTTLEALEATVARDALLLAPAHAVQGWLRVVVDDAQARRLAQGQQVEIAGLPAAAGRAAIFDAGGGLLGLARVEEARVAPVRWLQGAPTPQAAA